MIKFLAEKVLLKNDSLFMISKESGLVIEYDLRTHKVNIMKCLEEDMFYYSLLFGDIKQYENEIIVVPANSKNLYILNDAMEVKNKIQVSEKIGYMKYMSSEIVNNKLYLFGHGVLESVVIDLETETISKIKCLDGELFYSSYLDGDSVYLPSCRTNTLYVYNPIKKELQSIKIGNYSFNGISINEDKIFMAPRESKNLCILDRKTEEITEIAIPFCNSIGIFVLNDNIYLPSNIRGNSLVISRDKKISKWKEDTCYTLCYNAGNSVFLMDTDGNLTIIDKATGDEEKYPIQIDEGDLEKVLIKSKVSRDLYNRETNINNLKAFINSF